MRVVVAVLAASNLINLVLGAANRDRFGVILGSTGLLLAAVLLATLPPRRA